MFRNSLEMQPKAGVGRAFGFAALGTNIATIVKADYSSNVTFWRRRVLQWTW
jgi:hypothetical protein